MAKQTVIDGKMHVILAWDENVIDNISSSCGWKPLKENEEMTVHYDNKEFIIKRIK